jgi:hypothetical protein
MKNDIIIYLDLDGVLADFDKRYFHLFNETPGETRDKKNFNPNWKTFVLGKNFESLDWFPGAQDLLQYVSDLGVTVEILSSSGGERFQGEVTAQKLKWLADHGIHFKANIVPGRKLKKNYAHTHAILIDDTPDVIEDFNRAGGNGILHTSFDDTLPKLKRILEKLHT